MGTVMTDEAALDLVHHGFWRDIPRDRVWDMMLRGLVTVTLTEAGMRVHASRTTSEKTE